VRKKKLLSVKGTAINKIYCIGLETKVTVSHGVGPAGTGISVGKIAFIAAIFSDYVDLAQDFLQEQDLPESMFFANFQELQP
jgi:hypothetical protein